jgi:predicted enzyme involved in methoxymalonyl-ACP biosynthesis
MTPLIKLINPDMFLRKRKEIIRKILDQNSNYINVKVAVLGSSTTNEFIDFLEVFLLLNGIRPDFYQSYFNRIYEESVLDSSSLVDFYPDIIIVYSSSVGIRNFPDFFAEEEVFNQCLSKEIAQYKEIWDSLHAKTGALIIQNNFELPFCRILGNFDAVSYLKEKIY